MKLIRPRFLVLIAASVFLIPIVRSEQAPKTSRTSQEDRIKKLEDRADAAEKAATNAAMEKDFITRSQKLYESYYQRAFNTQMWTLGIVGLILTAVFGLVARFNLNMLVERSRLATTDATTQMRNEHARISAKEVQKLWDSNSADNKKLKEALTAQIAELEQTLKDRSDFQIHFVQGLASAVDARHDDCVITFRKALSAYRSGKHRNLFDASVGATTLRYIFESLSKKHGENYVDKAREELADPLYNDIQEELALAALQLSWLTPLINERNPAPPEPPAPQPVVESRSAASIPFAVSEELDLPVGEEFSSCRLINS